MTAPQPPKSSSTSSKALIGVLLAGTAGIIIFLFVHLSGSNTPTLGSKKAAASCKGDQCLPDVSYIDSNGTAYTRQSLAGKVVVINFWATWCKPCLKEIPDLSKIYEKYKGRGVVVLGILASDNPDNSTLLNFQSDNEMTFPVVRATSDILISYDYPGSLPTTFVYDRGGRQAHMQVGALSSERLEQILGPLISAN
ncbi:MAG: TlpA family protein disulfide reductase [Deltaproteobacteria bacterium]|nr:TlpA family protein disulfide reductase [Deltaproteobacteria bacterium]